METGNVEVESTSKAGFKEKIRDHHRKRPVIMVFIAAALLLVTTAAAVFAFNLLTTDKAVFESSINSDKPIKQHLLQVDGTGELVANLEDITQDPNNQVRFILKLLDDNGNELQKIVAADRGDSIQMAEAVTPGVYTFTISSKDSLSSAGAFYRLSVLYPDDTAEIADDIAPTVQITSPKLGATVKETFDVSGTANDNNELAQLSLRIDEGTWVTVDTANNWSASIDSTKFVNGQHIIDVRATDAAGNSTTDSILYNFDNEVPAPSPDPDPVPTPDPNPTPDPDPTPNPTPDPDPTPNPNPETGVLFTEDFLKPSSMNRFNTITWHRDPYLGGGSFQGDHAKVASGNDPDNCTNPFSTRKLNHAGSSLVKKPTDHVYRCAPGDDPGKAHIMTAQGPQSGYDFTAFWTKDSYANIKEVRWEQNITDLGGRNWSEVKVVPVSKWNPLQPPCAIAWVPCWTLADGGAGSDGTKTHADMGSVGANWFNRSPGVSSPVDDDSDNWNFRGDVNNSIRQLVESRFSAFSSPVKRFKHILRDNGNGTISLLIDTELPEYGVHEVSTIKGSFPTSKSVVVFATHNYTSGKGSASYDGETWHWDNIVIK